jgi:hypothetical protein
LTHADIRLNRAREGLLPGAPSRLGSKLSLGRTAEAFHLKALDTGWGLSANGAARALPWKLSQVCMNEAKLSPARNLTPLAGAFCLVI